MHRTEHIGLTFIKSRRSSLDGFIKIENAFSSRTLQSDAGRTVGGYWFVTGQTRKLDSPRLFGWGHKASPPFIEAANTSTFRQSLRSTRW